MDSKKDLLVRIGNVIERAKQARTGELYHTAPTWAVVLVDTVCGVLEEAEGHLREQDAEIAELRRIIAACAQAAGGHVTPETASLDFLRDVPGEVEKAVRGK